MCWYFLRINHLPPNGLGVVSKEKMIEVLPVINRYILNNPNVPVSLPEGDIQHLRWWVHDENAWLTGDIINQYLELICARNRDHSRFPKIFRMITHFLDCSPPYPVIREGGSPSNVDIFTFDIIFVPVHLHNHWCMAIIHISDHIITYYDPKGTPNQLVLDELERYLQTESGIHSSWNKENVQAGPQQINGYDCGVFSCMYAEFVSRKKRITSKVFTEDHMSYFRMKMVHEICIGKMIN